MIHEFFEGIPIVESLILILISFIGSIIHEYIFNHRSNFFKNPNVIITVVVSYLISFSIDPFIMQLSPRFIITAINTWAAWYRISNKAIYSKRKFIIIRIHIRIFKDKTKGLKTRRLWSSYNRERK